MRVSVLMVFFCILISTLKGDDIMIKVEHIGESDKPIPTIVLKSPGAASASLSGGYYKEYLIEDCELQEIWNIAVKIGKIIHSGDYENLNEGGYEFGSLVLVKYKSDTAFAFVLLDSLHVSCAYLQGVGERLHSEQAFVSQLVGRFACAKN